MQHYFFYVPLVRNIKIRMVAGLVLLVLSIVFAGSILNKGQVEVIIAMGIVAWGISVLLTEKYVHKYPQRYFTYLIASHAKAAIIMASLLFVMSFFFSSATVPIDVLWYGFIIFVLADILFSIPRRPAIPIPVQQCSNEGPPPAKKNVLDDQSTVSNAIDTPAILKQIRMELGKPLIEFIENNLPFMQGGNGKVSVIDDIKPGEVASRFAPVGLLVGRTRINDVRRLNRFLTYCAENIVMGGYLVIRYTPLDTVVNNLRKRYKGLFYWIIFTAHFMWYRALPKIPWLDALYFSRTLSWLDKIYLSMAKRRSRVLSKAEAWGRLAYCGMNVIAESKGDNEKFIVAQRTASAAKKRIVSYYPIVPLEKVGLDGKIIHTHKIRTMFPFSEFLQKRIFEDHGLASTGKFANDFRLTEYGKFMRKYWLDELPQIFDWLRGDIKLVGMRATSSHFLSLYPKELYDLYVQIKPGLIPPIFDENTNGFDQIVEVELKYLRSYWEQPFKTDVRYFLKTFTDIVFRGIRSK
jgi:lipopolysaccharide/colanic/teichoic acid biosynthesis glycosyltransferase